MGYCGFGIQRWIYNLKPRKPFKRRDFPGGYEVIPIARFQFKLKDTVLHTSESIDRRNINQNKTAKIGKIYSILGDYFIISFCLFLIYLIALIHWNFGSSEYAKQMNANYFGEPEGKELPFQLCMRYGEHYLLNEDYDIALEEFTQATRLYPENKRANTLGIITKMLMKEPCDWSSEIQKFEEIKMSKDFYLSPELIDLINRKMRTKK